MSTGEIYCGGGAMGAGGLLPGGNGKALAEARGKLARSAYQTVVAPLFFRNADLSPRLDGFEPGLLDAFTSSNAVRVLRFPQSDPARDESELTVRGWSEDAWRRVADLYVWGSYKELPAPGAGFAQTPVEIELTLWNGVNPPRSLKEKTVVAELPAVARRLAERCLDAARRLPKTRGVPAVDVRGEIARSLREQGQRLEARAASHGLQRDAFLHTPEGQRVERSYTVADGLVTANAAVGGQMYFAGHENGRPLLSGFDPARQALVEIDKARRWRARR